MRSKKISICRICSSKNIEMVFSLGNISHAGIFPKKKTINVPKEYINVVYCKDC